MVGAGGGGGAGGGAEEEVEEVRSLITKRKRQARLGVLVSLGCMSVPCDGFVSATRATTQQTPSCVFVLVGQ